MGKIAYFLKAVASQVAQQVSVGSYIVYCCQIVASSREWTSREQVRLLLDRSLKDAKGFGKKTTNQQNQAKLTLDLRVVAPRFPLSTQKKSFCRLRLYLQIFQPLSAEEAECNLPEKSTC